MLLPKRIVAGIDHRSMVRAVSQTLQRIDARLMEHGDRVAFIACELCRVGALPLDEEALFLLSVFHDIGAYKTDEIDRMVEFETKDVGRHAIYGYLFLRHMSPLSEKAETILFHHTPWTDPALHHSPYRDYAALIHLADRIDIAFLHREDPELFQTLTAKQTGMFNPDHLELARRCFHEHALYERLEDGSYRAENEARLERFAPTADIALAYLEMLVFAIDFRSECTVTHTINTVMLALDIAGGLGLDDEEQQRIALGALLHDVGKISIPAEILESPGRLTPEQMTIMRTHVVETEKIIRDIVPDDICRIAVRHHEKLDGSGYPRALTARDLTLGERIVAVSDVVSALISRRSYKEPFPREETLRILQEMRECQLDPRVCDYVCTQYDDILTRTDNGRSEVVRKYQTMREEFVRRSNPSAAH